MFISFEGIDGSGKSTQARLLSATLRARGLGVVDVRDPGGTATGEAVRQVLLQSDAQIEPRTELLLFSAARAQMVEEVIRPALAAGSVVIADRYIDSSTAYQGGGRGLGSVEWFHKHHQFVTGGCMPELTFLLTVDGTVAAERRNNRDADRMESADPEYYARIARRYSEVATAYPQRVVVLDGAADVAILQEEVERRTLNLLQRS